MLSNKSNKELVEAGHQFAKALDADMPLTDIAKLVSVLASRLDCAIVRGNELQQKLDVVVAEGAALKSNLMFWDAEDPESPYDCPEDIANNCCMDFNTEFDVWVAAKMPNRTYRVYEAGEYDCKIELVSGGMPETPATDAYLDSVRAEGVEMFAKHCDDNVTFVEPEDEALYTLMEEAAREFAAQLRSGTHDTAKDGE